MKLNQPHPDYRLTRQQFIDTKHVLDLALQERRTTRHAYWLALRVLFIGYCRTLDLRRS
jgi:hypothetical protein